MALTSDDSDIRPGCFWMELGGNGDYYINTMEVKNGQAARHSIRISMSGGNAPHEVKMAAFRLYKALEDAELNEHPKNEGYVKSI